jgi:hypothetical protein
MMNAVAQCDSYSDTKYMTSSAENQAQRHVPADDAKARTNGASGEVHPSENAAEEKTIIRKTVLMPESVFAAVEDHRWSARLNFSESFVQLAELGLAVQRGEYIPKR